MSKSIIIISLCQVCTFKLPTYQKGTKADYKIDTDEKK